MIPFNNFQAEPKELIAKEIEAATRVIRSGSYILGAELRAFESNWAHYCGVKHAIGVGNGMDAIEIGLRALGIKAGDEIVTTAMTAFATVLAIVRTGATPVFADIDASTGLMSMESAIRCFSSKTKGVVLVHLYGHMYEVSNWRDECLKRGLFLIEDCAQAHGSKWKGVSSGGFGALGAFSFYPTKNLGALGDGGAILTKSDDLAASIRVILNYGQSQRYHHPVLGLNSRLDEMQAAILMERLMYLEEFIERRRQIANHYRAELKNRNITLLQAPEFPENHVYHLFVVKANRRSSFAEYLEKNGITTLSHYPIPAHKQKASFNFRVDSSGLPNTEQYSNQCISIPCHPQMSEADVQFVIEKINAFN